MAGPWLDSEFASISLVQVPLTGVLPKAGILRFIAGAGCTITGAANPSNPNGASSDVTIAVSGGGSSVTGTGIWHSVAGVLDAAAYIGTANQLLATNSGATATAWVTPGGSVSYAGGSFAVLAADGSAGLFAVHCANVFFDAGVTAPTISQAQAVGAAGQPLLIQAQQGGSGTHPGGDLQLSSGTHGTFGNFGSLSLQVAGAELLRLDGPTQQIVAEAPVKFQETGLIGYTLSDQAEFSGASTTALYALAIATDTTVLIDVSVTATRTDDSASTGAKLTASVRNHGGALVVDGGSLTAPTYSWGSGTVAMVSAFPNIKVTATDGSSTDDWHLEIQATVSP